MSLIESVIEYFYGSVTLAKGFGNFKNSIGVKGKVPILKCF